MARPGLKFDLLTPPKAVNAKPQPMGGRICAVCGGRASFGEGKRVEVAVWHCREHWPDRPEKARVA